MKLEMDIKDLSGKYAKLLDLLYKAEFVLIDVYPEEDINQLKNAAKDLYERSIELAIEKSLISEKKVDNFNVEIPSFMVNERSS